MHCNYCNFYTERQDIMKTHLSVMHGIQPRENYNTLMGNDAIDSEINTYPENQSQQHYAEYENQEEGFFGGKKKKKKNIFPKKIEHTFHSITPSKTFEISTFEIPEQWKKISEHYYQLRLIARDDKTFLKFRGDISPGHVIFKVEIQRTFIKKGLFFSREVTESSERILIQDFRDFNVGEENLHLREWELKFMKESITKFNVIKGMIF